MMDHLCDVSCYSLPAGDFYVNINPQIGQPWGALILKQWAIYRQGVPARWSLADCSSFLLARGRFVSTSHSQNIFVT